VTRWGSYWLVALVTVGCSHHTIRVVDSDDVPASNARVDETHIALPPGALHWKYATTLGLRDVTPSYATGRGGLLIGRIVSYSFAFHMKLRGGDRLVQMTDIECDSVPACRSGYERLLARAKRATSFSIEIVRDTVRMRFRYTMAPAFGPHHGFRKD
jgi:hypothetical protein